MRIAISAIVAMAAVAGVVTAAQAQETTYHVCVVYGHGTGGSQTVAITEPFPYQGDGMSRLENQFESFIYDLQRGRVQIGVDASIVRRGECFAGGTDRSGQVQHMQNRLRHAPGAVVFTSPLDVMGMYRRAGTTSAARPAKPAAENAAPAEPAAPVKVRATNPLGKTPNQVKYELAMAVHRARLAANEKAKAEVEAKKARQREAARQVLSQHDQAMSQHRQVVAASDREQAEYRAKLATPAPKAPEERVEFKEGVVACEKRSASSKEWRCQGPLQVTYAVLDTDKARVPLGQACGSDRSIRDLGMISSYRIFGCGFGIHPTARDYPGNTDVPAKLGLGYIPGRASFYCPRSKLAYCRG